MSALPEGRNDFGKSLLAQLQAKGTLSEKQQRCADDIIAKHKASVQAQAEESPKDAPEQFNGIFSLFDAAVQSKGLRQPKMTLGRADGGKIVLSLAGESARVPGSLNVASDKFGQGDWFGRIRRDGGFEPNSRIAKTVLDGVLDDLRILNQNPKEVARSNGRAFGFCCFCNRTLSDAVSVANGYGPICAEKFGL